MACPVRPPYTELPLPAPSPPLSVGLADHRPPSSPQGPSLGTPGENKGQGRPPAPLSPAAPVPSSLQPAPFSPPPTCHPCPKPPPCPSCPSTATSIPHTPIIANLPACLLSTQKGVMNPSTRPRPFHSSPLPPGVRFNPPPRPTQRSRLSAPHPRRSSSAPGTLCPLGLCT